MSKNISTEKMTMKEECVFPMLYYVVDVLNDLILDAQIIDFHKTNKRFIPNISHHYSSYHHNMIAS